MLVTARRAASSPRQREKPFGLTSAIRHKYHGSLEEVLEFWMRSARAIVAAKRRLGDRMIVREFEGLVADPAELMMRVCECTELGDYDSPFFGQTGGDGHGQALTAYNADLAAPTRIHEPGLLPLDSRWRRRHG